MENLQDKNLSELFDLGIKLNSHDKSVFLKKVQQFSPKYARELEKMFASDPSQMGLGAALSNLGSSSNSVSPLEIPKKIGKFNIISILGFGGMGMVFLGKRHDINQTVAVKIAHSSKPDLRKTQAITQEAKILASLQHSNIASLVDWGEHNSGYYVATEFVNGTTITNYCHAKQLNVRESIELFIKVIDAVEFAHENLIIHRDIKPSNIMVDETKEPILIDFGVARLMKSEDVMKSEGVMKSEDAIHQQTADTALTPIYASPEQLKGESVSVRSDIYSLATVLLHIITGEQVDNKQEQAITPIIQKQVDNNFQQSKKNKKWHKISRQMRHDLALILGKALAYSPKLRYANAYSFKQDLQALLTLKPIIAHEPSRWYWFRKFIARNKMTTAILAVALIATMFGGWQWYRAVDLKNAAVDLKEDYFNYSKFLESTLIGMNAYEGGSADITMDKFMDRAVKIYKEETKASPRQLSYHAHVLSKIYNSWGRFSESIEVLDIGLKHAKQSKSPVHIATILGQKAVLLLNLSNYQQCIETAKEAIVVATDINNSQSDVFNQKIAIQIILSKCYSANGEYTKSIDIAKAAIADTASTKLNKAQAYYAIGETQVSLYQFAESLMNYKNSEKLFLELFGKDSGLVVSTQATIVYLEAQLNPKTFELKKQERVVALAAKTYGQNSANATLVKAMMANTFFLKNQLNKAIDIMEQVLPVLEVNQLSTQAIRSKLTLVNYYLLNDEVDAAQDTMHSITAEDLTQLTGTLVKSTYYSHAFRLAIQANNMVLAKKSLMKAKKFLTDSIDKNAIISLHFRISQLAALESNYQSCFDNAQKATDMATNLYPKTWQLANAYRYLQDVCQHKLSGIENNGFTYLPAVLDSPWKQETVLTTKILNLQ